MYTYVQEKRKRIKFLLRMKLGVQELVRRPMNLICILMIAILYVSVWRYKEEFFQFAFVPDILDSVFQYVISTLLIVVYILLVLCVIKNFGEMTARKDEAALVVAFTATQLRNGHPILISRKKVKGTDVIVREFYSAIPKSCWEKMKEEIADAMNVHFVNPEIEYGGKNRDNSNRIRIYTIAGRIAKDRGTLYDDV